MAIFKLSTPDGLEVIVRGKCITCARNIAADNALEEGPRTWLSPTLSTITVLRENDPPGLLLRGMPLDSQ